MNISITAVVNIYKRPHLLLEQINSIKNQSVPPECIFILNNGNKEIDLSEYRNDHLFKIFDCNFNTGVWTRFLISQLAKSEYICIFDDDTIPGSNWFKNCLESMNQKEALYGTIGVIFQDGQNYRHLKRYGWDNNNIVSTPVDIVGHSWFFKKKWVSVLLREPDKINKYINVGEDMTFSYMLQKYANIATYVPPHPRNDLSLFGSLPDKAWKYGLDGNSGSSSSGFDNVLNIYKKEGFNILITRQEATSSEDFKKIIEKIKDWKPFALIRPADGEYHILKNMSITNIDNWTFSKNGSLHTDLMESIHLASKKNCFIGIPCGCCNFEIGKYYITNFQLHPLYTTFANIFVNKNWKDWIDFLMGEKIPFIFVGPEDLPIKFVVQKYIHIPLKLVNDWDSKGKEFLFNTLNLLKQYRNKLILFAGGPISKILISHAWNEYPYNIYLDIGSSLDIFMKKSSNREYTINQSRLSQLECKFDKNLINI